MPIARVSVRCNVAIGVAALASGCTSLLGIDGNYAVERPGSQGSGGREGSGAFPSNGARSSGDFDAGVPMGAGGEPTPGSGGVRIGDGGSGVGGGSPNGGTGAGGAPESGGRPGAGGATPAAGGANAGTAGNGKGGASGSASGGSSGSSSGGTAPDAGPPPCPTGTFRGTYMGTDRPSTGGTVVPVPIAGTVVLHLAAMGESHLAVTGTLLDPIDDPTGGVGAMLTGSIDCVQRTGTMTLSKATLTIIVPSFLGPVDGTMDISVDSTTSLSGDFNIHETINPTFATGSGSWSADRTGP
jgi:hypothetical protein